MTKQEEIREGIDRDIEFALMAAYYAGKTGEPLGETIDKCKAYLKEGLRSQGVVIKVERELPLMSEPSKTFYESNKENPTIAQWMTGYITAQQELKRDGYVAVEPLIGDKDA